MRTGRLETDLGLSSDRSRVIAGVFLIALFCVLYLLFLGVRPLFIPDEPRYAEIAREMLASGNWVVPRLNGLLYFEKPPLGHWLNAMSLFVFGQNGFGVRFASALSTGVSALMVFHLGRTYFRSQAIPLLAAFVFLTTLEVQAIGTFAVLDPSFSATLNGGILAMAASAYSAGRRRILLLAVSGVIYGMAFLAKGFLALVLPVLVLVPWLLVRGDYAFLLKRAWIAVVFAALTVAPWALAIDSQQPDFWRYFFWVEHIQRFAADNAQHKEPFYYFLMFLPALAFPWVFLLPATIRGLRAEPEEPARPHALLLLVLWAVVPFVFFSIASGKLSTYILPCFVPFSVLTAVGLHALGADTRRTRWLMVAAAIAAALLLLALAIYAATSSDLVFLPGERLKQASLYAALAIMAGALLIGAFSGSNRTRLLLAGLSVVPFLIALPLSMPESVLESKAPVQFLESTIAPLPKDTALVTNGSLVRAMSWAAKRADVHVIENGGETTYGLDAPDAAGRFLRPDDLRTLIASSANVLVVCKGPCSDATLSVVPDRAVSSSYGNFFAYYVARSRHSGTAEADE